MAPPLDSLLDVVAARIIAAADELTALDSAIGDADHGLNMKRGFEAVLAERAAILAKPLGEALKTVGMTLVMKVGGASGPLYGTLFMTLGKELGPVATHLGGGGASFASVRALAAERAQATVPMKAIKGRASFLGDRSIGHMDPGARSSQIMIEAVCDVLEGRA